MTDAATLAAAVAVGAVLGAAGMYAVHLRWAEAHHFRRIRLEATRVDQLYDTADHERRLRERWEARALGLRDAVGDLLDKVAARDRAIARLRRPRHLAQRNPIPTYGRWAT